MYTFIYGSDMFSRFVLILLHLLQNIRLHNYTFYTCKIKSFIFVSSREFTWFSSVIFTESDNRKMSSKRQVNINPNMVPATTAHSPRSVTFFPPVCEFKHKAHVLTTVTARIQRLKTAEKKPAFTQVVIAA